MNIDLFNLLDIVDRLKHLKRTGWVHHEIENPETVAAHMYRMAILALTLTEERKDLDIGKCVEMALVHDIGEAIIGDITPYCGVSEEEKQEREHKAVEEIASYVPDSIGRNWVLLWREYDAGLTPEARAVKQLDKFDMLAQAYTYEEKFGKNLEEFVESTKQSFTEAPFVEWAAKVREKYAELRSSRASNTKGSDTP